MLKKFLLISFFFLTIFLPIFVLATDPVKTCGEGTGKLCFIPAITIPGFLEAKKSIDIDGSSLANYIVKIYRYGAMFAGVIAMFMLVYAGWQWLLAGGNSSKISQAREKINGALIGLTLLFGGYILLSLISTNLIKFRPLDTTLPKLCVEITDPEKCVVPNCTWIPATYEENLKNPEKRGACEVIKAGCISDSLLKDISVPGITIRGDCRDPRLTGPTMAKLVVAAEKAKSLGHRLVITGAFRSAAYQQELFDCYDKKVANVCPQGCESCNKASKPDCQKSTHMQGIAVDICIVISGGIDMCGYIDEAYNCHAGSISSWCSSHPGMQEAELALKEIMTQSGFTGISDEWWHYQNNGN